MARCSSGRRRFRSFPRPFSTLVRYTDVGLSFGLRRLDSIRCVSSATQSVRSKGAISLSYRLSSRVKGEQETGKTDDIAAIPEFAWSRCLIFKRPRTESYIFRFLAPFSRQAKLAFYLQRYFPSFSLSASFPFSSSLMIPFVVRNEIARYKVSLLHFYASTFPFPFPLAWSPSLSVPLFHPFLSSSSLRFVKSVYFCVIVTAENLP